MAPIAQAGNQQQNRFYTNLLVMLLEIENETTKEI